VKLIVGLGNPGEEYAGTRHNIGFDVVDVLASRWRIGMGVEKFHGTFGKGDIRGRQVVMLKPMTFMNRSGRAVVATGRFYKLELADLLVVTDDLALPLGRLRMRARGSSGGHNGLQSVIDRVGTDEWCRLRVGIGPPVGVPTAHVLTRFEGDEEAVMRRARGRAADAVECWVADGPDLAMTRFNADPGERHDDNTSP